MLEPLFKYCHDIHPMPQQLVDDLNDYAVVKEYKKDEVILRPGQVANYAYWILKGLVRSYYLKETEDITTKFLWDGATITSIYSYYSRKPGNEYIVALEDTTVAAFHYDHMKQMYKDHPEFNVIGRVTTERYLFFLEIELYNLRKVSAEARYHFFCKHFPHLLQRVPLKYIATYLGMNMETLSRIRARRK